MAEAWQSDPIVSPASDPGFTGFIPGTPKPPALASGYEPDPTYPGGVRPQHGGPADLAADAFDPETTTFYAQKVLAGAPPESYGMGKVGAANRRQVMEKVAELAGAKGLTGADQARQVTHYKAQSANITNLEKQLGTVSQAEQTALLNGQQFLDRSAELPGGSETPWINSATQALQRNLPVPGHDTVSAMDAAYNTFVNEYAKVVAGSPTGTGTMSDSARHEAMDTIRSNASVSQKKAAFAQMKADMANRIASSHNVIEQSYKALTEKPGYIVPDDLGQAGTGGSVDLNPKQRSDYAAFMATNPDEAKVKTFLEGMIGKGQVTNAAEIIARYKQDKGLSGTATLNETKAAAPSDPAYQQQLKDRIALENKLGVGDTPAEVLAHQGSTLNLSDEAAGIGNAGANILGSLVGGKFDPVAAYQLERDAERMRIADARQQLGGGGAALEFASGFGGLGAGARAAGLTVAQIANGGAAVGALGGFGEGEGVGNSALGAAVGVGAGKALGHILPVVGGKIINRLIPPDGRTPLGLDPALAAASVAEDVPIRQTMIKGNRKAVVKAGRLEADPTTAAFMQASHGETADAIGAGVKRLGKDGRALTPAELGDTWREAAKNIQRVDRQGATSSYATAEAAQPGVMVDAAEMRTHVDAKLAKLSLRPSQNRAEIKALTQYRADLGNPLPLQEIRDMRTNAYDNIYGGGTRSSEQKRADRFMMGVVDASKKDIATALKPEALAAWQKADGEFAGNQQFYREAVKPLFGGNLDNLSGEQVYDKVRYAAQKNGRALAAFHRRLPIEESRNFAATIADGLGKNHPDDPFSPDLFARQIRKFSPSARETIFGPSGSASLDNLLLLSRRLKMAGTEINQSKTARPVMGVIRAQATNFLLAVLGGGGAVLGGGMGAAEGVGAGLAVKSAVDGTGAIRRIASAKILMNPKVTRWMADAALVNTPAEAKAMTTKLGVIMQREPAIAGDIKWMHDLLSQKLGMPLAADPNQGGGSNDQPQQ